MIFCGGHNPYSLGGSVFQALWKLYQTSNTIATLLDELPDYGTALQLLATTGSTRADWRAHLKGWRDSNFNQREYCELHGLAREHRRAQADRRDRSACSSCNLSPSSEDVARFVEIGLGSR